MAGNGKAFGIAGAKARAFVAATVLLAAAATTPAQAAPLNLTIQPAPEIFSDAIDVSYDARSQTFAASGFAEHAKSGTEAPVQILNGTMRISANITNSGEVVAGKLTITGEIPSLGVGPGELVVGDLKAVGGDAGGVTELQFSTNGGALAFQFGPSINVILGQSGFKGSFAENFSNGAIGVAGIGW